MILNRSIIGKVAPQPSAQVNYYLEGGAYQLYIPWNNGKSIFSQATIDYDEMRGKIKPAPWNTTTE